MWKAMKRIIDSGVQQGREKLGNLIQWLIDQSRTDEIERVIRDKEYRNQLFEEADLIHKTFN